MNNGQVKEYTVKGFINGALIIFAVGVFFADIIFIEEAFTGLGILMAIGVFLISPNVIVHEIKRSKRLAKQHHCAHLPQDRMGGYYTMYTAPVDYKKKLFWPMIRRRFFGMVVIVAVAIALLFIESNNLGSSFSKISGGAGMMILGILIFGFPVLAYYVTDSVMQVRTLLRGEYEMYHAVISKINYSDFTIRGEKFICKFEYCNCVGIRKKKLNSTPVIMIFILDQVYIVPDKMNEPIR